jgi:predicted O-methyltransferase YrrM
LSTWNHIKGISSHYIRSGNEHDVHSPFVFRLLTEAIYQRGRLPSTEKFESIRKNLLNDQTVLEVTDLGAGSSFDGKLKKRTVADITRKFAKPPSYCRMLHRVVQLLKPSLMIELGTSMGISCMYQASANPNGYLYTLEGCPSTANKASENLKFAGIKNAEVITGHFDETLPVLLQKTNGLDYLFVDGNHTCDATLRYFESTLPYCHDQSVIIFDDINWSEGMQEAWKKIINHKQVTISINFYFLGMVFFNEGFSRQQFRLRPSWK